MMPTLHLCICCYITPTLLPQGDPVTVSNAVCMHEEDAGLLWKHVDYRSGHSESRRSRRLVLQNVATVVNYEYQCQWMLYQVRGGGGLQSTATSLLLRPGWL